jgi:SAM-dependent methyltransferase
MPSTTPSDAPFSDDDVAALYDADNPWDESHPENVFVSALVRDAESVLDVGCGTGSMLHVARQEGHQGRLAGIDPDRSMLDRALRRQDIEWVLGKAEDIAWENEFGLATMNSNAFQCLLTDADVRASLAAIRRALHEGGRFAFGTRHVQARAWDSWNPSNGYGVTASDGRVLRIWHEVEEVVGDVVTVTETTGLPDGTVLRVDRAGLRFWDVPALGAFLAEAGFEVDEQYGDWKRGPVTSDSREIVTIARRV